jgi:hypothetical protein
MEYGAFYLIIMGPEITEKYTKSLNEQSDFFQYICVHDILKVMCVATLINLI